jgi:N-acetylglutamate synthase-like GNAT family acetyltransferase
VRVRKVEDKDRPSVLEIVRKWGADFVVTRRRLVYPAQIDGFLAEDDNGATVGLVTYEVTGNDCEIVTLDAFEQYQGIGTALIERVRDAARVSGCTRLWLITTNDNLDAIRFYQRRGFTIAAVHSNSIEHSRLFKPTIPRVGNYGIPIRDEIEFEMCLD